MFKENIKKILNSEYLILLAILILAAIFRFYKLRTVPDWFNDEGEFIRLADYLSKGNFNFIGIRNSLLLIGRPPLFIWFLAGAFKLFGTDISVLRGLTVVSSILTIGICYSLVRQALGRAPAFYAAFLLAIMPEYIFYNRIGFTYNWTSLWMLIFVLALWKYLKQDSQLWLVTACMAAGIAFASDYIGIICIFVLLFVLAFYHPRHLWKVVLAGIPILVSTLPIFAIAPSDAWYDLRYIFFLGKGGTGSASSIPYLIQGYVNIILKQPLIVLGMVGIFTLPNKRLFGLIFLVVSGVFILFLPIRTLQGQYLLPAWPFLMIGLGSILVKTLEYFFINIKSSLVNLQINEWWTGNEKLRSLIGSIGSSLITFVFIFLPITWLIIVNIRAFIIEPLIPSLAMQENPSWLVNFTAAADAEAIANEISPTLKPSDFVIAPGQVSWLLPCHTADIRTVGAYEFGGKTLDLYEYDMNRFIVNSSINNARYAIADNYWRVWVVTSIPEYDLLWREVSNWPILMIRGNLQLFCNPQYCGSN